jgi:pimeloyl-ACP methyl ester carboxylesterase
MIWQEHPICCDSSIRVNGGYGMTAYILVGGAWMGGWCWQAVARPLRAEGHDVYPVTLTGLGERSHLARPEIDLDTHITDIVNLIEYEDLHDAVLVGHSYAGVVVTGAADRRPDRLAAVVYLDCSPLPDGMAIIDAQGVEQREMQRAAVERDGDGWRWPVPDRDTLARGLFGSTAGLEERHFAVFEQRGTPQPYATFTTPLRLARARPPEVRRAAIFCTDGGITVADIRTLLEQGDPRAALFADPDWDLRELATGHWAMFSAPEHVAELLHMIAT